MRWLSKWRSCCQAWQSESTPRTHLVKGENDCQKLSPGCPRNAVESRKHLDSHGGLCILWVLMYDLGWCLWRKSRCKEICGFERKGDFVAFKRQWPSYIVKSVCCFCKRTEINSMPSSQLPITPPLGWFYSSDRYLHSHEHIHTHRHMYLQRTKTKIHLLKIRIMMDVLLWLMIMPRFD